MINVTFLEIVLFVSHILIWVLWTILIKYSRMDNAYPYNPVSVILFTEVAKLCLAIFFHLTQVGVRNIPEEASKIVSQYRIGVYFALPSFIYALYNALYYLNLSYFDPVSYRVLINLRILWSGLLFQLIFKKQLGFQKWVALIILLLGCTVNQMNTDLSIDFSNGFFLISIIFQAFTSSFGGVCNEFLLKKDIDISLNVKNMYLYVFSILFYGILIITFYPHLILEQKMFEGFSPLVWGLIFIGAFCGFSTAVFLKYMNIILKEYAHSGEMIFTAVISYFMFGQAITVNVLASIALVSISIYVYSQASAESQSAEKANSSKDIELGKVRTDAKSPSGRRPELPIK